MSSFILIKPLWHHFYAFFYFTFPLPGQKRKSVCPIFFFKSFSFIHSLYFLDIKLTSCKFCNLTSYSNFLFSWAEAQSWLLLPYFHPLPFLIRHYCHNVCYKGPNAQIRSETYNIGSSSRRRWLLARMNE